MTLCARIWMVIGAVSLALAIPIPMTNAAPWLEPGDPRARSAMQKLADRGHLDRPTTTWPLMWANLEGVAANAITDRDAVGSSLAYLNFERDQQMRAGYRVEVGVSGTTETTTVRGFQGAPRASEQATAQVQWQGQRLAAGLSGTYAIDPDDGKNYRADGSYLAGTAGNWVIGAGALDRWWGPGWQSSLILSNNARPVPAVWLNRRNTTAPSTDWLEWVGPWQFTVLAGELEKERAVSEPKLLGMRLALRPVQGLDIGLSRTIMFNGEGRPDSASAFFDSLIGRDNSQDGGENDPGNQVAGVDARYGFGVGDQSAGVYTQVIGEDEAGDIPAPTNVSWLFGADWTTQFLDSDQQWFVEYANTFAGDLSGDGYPNITYEHFNYKSGYRYYGRPLGASFGGDAEAMTLGAYNFLPGGDNLDAKLSYVQFNKDGDVRTQTPDADIAYSVPTKAQDVAMVELGYGTEFFRGWLDLNFQGTSEQVELISGSADRVSVGASWRYRF
ncbi:hypothetical protein BA899_09670 [Spiribacter sp. SSL99]|nr:hypothetical protein BA899_09670 [Spiribacter sp. SSL99]